MFQPRQFLQSAKWMLVSNWGREGILCLVTFLLAAILGPNDFGTVAIAVSYIEFINMLVGFGFNATLIQRKDLTPLHLDSVFWLILASSLFFTAVSIVLSDWWAAANHSVQLSPVISVLSITIPVHGLVVVQQALFHRKMDFKTLALRDNISVFAGGVVGVGMALLGFGVWALVGQQLCRTILSLVLLWHLSNWRPSFRFSIKHARGTLSFSSKVFVGKMGDYVQGYSCGLLLGVFVGPEAVGLYRLASRMMQIPLKLVARAIHTVSLPQFSRFQDDRLDLKNTLLFCLRASSIVTIPAMMGLSAMSGFVMAAVGPEWSPAANVLMILCIVGFVKALTLFTGTLLQSISKPGTQTTLTWCFACAGVMAFIITGVIVHGAPIAHQVICFAWAHATVFLAFMPVNLYIAARHTGIRMREFISTIGPGILVGLVIFLGVITLKATNALEGMSPLFALAIIGVFASFIGFGALVLFDRQLRQQISKIYLKKLRWVPRQP